jgi:hypothetical protein
MPVTHLSRQELMSLLYDKLQTIRDEADEIVDPDVREPRHLPSAKLRLKRIAVEARRAASLIETYEIVSKAGHCLHCGKTYEEHEERAKLPEGGVLVRAKDLSPDGSRCNALKALFESVEIETYQGVQVVECG